MKTSFNKSKKVKKSKRKFPKFEIPTIEKVEEAIINLNSPLYPHYVYYFFKNRDWRYPKGKKVRCLSDMITYLTKIYYSNYGLPPVQPIVIENLKSKEKWIPYDEQLKDPRWFVFREKVFAERGTKCEKCGSITNLQVHHIKYITGKKAWEYPINMVRVLCRNCHRKEHDLDIE